MAVVISDTSPVRALAHLGILDWLRELFVEVVLPPAVAGELRNPPAGLPVVEPGDWSFLRVQAPGNSRRVSQLCALLDAGEAEAIALAEELQAEVVLMDELAGRGIARQAGFAVIGTLGILLQAKQLGLCPEIRPLLDRLESEIHFFISSSLQRTILQQAGEAA